jgi:integrase
MDARKSLGGDNPPMGSRPPFDPSWNAPLAGPSERVDENASRPCWNLPVSMECMAPGLEMQQFHITTISQHPLDRVARPDPAPMSLAEFVGCRFAPEYVAVKRSAGRAHFQAILKHILTPEAVDRAFGVKAKADPSRVRIKAIPGWPYMDSFLLSDVTPETIQFLISTALQHGYSSQTVIHIRSVLRAIFSHARLLNYFDGKNPATQAVPPEMARKEAHALTLAQLVQVMQSMRYPEKEIALFATLTGMSIAEVCGLQWKYLNLSDLRHLIDGEWVPARAIAIRNQSYRGEFGQVKENRKRILFVPELLTPLLQALRRRKSFTAPNDFVLASRYGTPICQNNLANRRLKSIGKSLGMPWLSWHVFHRTHVALKSEFGRKFIAELKGSLNLEYPEPETLQPVPIGTRSARNS